MSTTPQQVNVWSQPHMQAGLNIDGGNLIVTNSIIVNSGTHDYGSVSAHGTSSFGYASNSTLAHNNYLGLTQVGLEVRGSGNTVVSGPAMVFHWEGTNSIYLWNNKTGTLTLKGDNGASLYVQNNVTASGSISVGNGHLITPASTLILDRTGGGNFAWHVDISGTNVFNEIATLNDNGNLSIIGKFMGDGSGLNNVALLDNMQLVAHQYLPINGLVYGPELNGIARFENSTTTTRGTQATFSRSTVANETVHLGQVQANKPRYTTGHFGNAIYIEEGTTNLVMNTEGATYTTAYTLLNDSFTNGNGWTLASGSFTYSASGALAAASGSKMYTGDLRWQPLVGSNNNNISLTFQTNFTLPATLPAGGLNMEVDLYQDVNNMYGIRYNVGTGNAELYKILNGTTTVIASGSFTETVSSTYTLSIARDPSGNLTGEILNSSGTTLVSLTGNSTALTGGFNVMVGADLNITLTAASLSGPWADSWWVNHNGADYAIGLVEDQLDGKNAIAFNMFNYGGWCVVESGNISVVSGSQYTMTFWAKADQNVTCEIGLEVHNASNIVFDNNINLTTTWQKFTLTGTAPTSVNNETVYIRSKANNVWTYFTAFQVENKAYATSYVQNNSTTSTQTRAAESLTYPTNEVIGIGSPWSIMAWAKTDVNADVHRMPFAAWQNFYVDLNNNNQPQFSWEDTNGQQHTTAASNQLANPTDWHHWAVTFDGSTVTVYIDAVVALTTTTTLPYALPSTLTVGSLNGSSYFWNGAIDELLFFNEAMSNVDVYDIYTNTSPIIDAYQSSVDQINGFNISMTPQPEAIPQYDDNGSLTTNTLYVENSIQVQGNGVSEFNGDVNIANSVYIPSGTLFDNTGKAVTNNAAIGAYYDGLAIKSNTSFGADAHDAFAVITNDGVHLMDVTTDGHAKFGTDLSINGKSLYLNTQGDAAHSMFWNNIASADTLTIQFGQNFAIQSNQSSSMITALSLDEWGNMQLGGSFTTFGSLNVANMSDRNLLLNGSFESGDLTNWTIVQPSGTTVTSSIVTAVDAPHGNKYVQLNLSGNLASNNGAGLYQTYNFASGYEYTLTAWIWAPKGVSVALNNAVTNVTNVYVPQGLGDWQRYVWKLSSQASNWTTNLTLAFWTGNSNQGTPVTVYIDAVQLEQGWNWSEYSEQYGQFWGDQTFNKGNVVIENGSIELATPNAISFNAANGDNGYQIYANNGQMYLLGDGGFVFQHNATSPTTAMSMNNSGVTTIGTNTTSTLPNLIINGPLKNANQWGNIYIGGGNGNYDISFDGGGDGIFVFGNTSTASGAMTKFYGTSTTGTSIEILDLNSTGNAVFRNAVQIYGSTTSNDTIYALKTTASGSIPGALTVGSTSNWTASGTANGIIGFPGYGMGHAQIAWVPGTGIFMADSSIGDPAGQYSTNSNRVPLYVGKLYTTNSTLDDGSGNATLGGSLIVKSGNALYLNSRTDNNHRIFQSSNVAEWWEYGQINIRAAGGNMVSGSTPALNINNGNVTIPKNLIVSGTTSFNALNITGNFTLSSVGTADSTHTHYASNGLYLLGSSWNGSTAVNNGFILSADGNNGLNLSFDNAGSISNIFNFNSNGSIGINGGYWYSDPTNFAVRVPKLNSGTFYVEYSDGSDAPLHAGSITVNGTLTSTGSRAIFSGVDGSSYFWFGTGKASEIGTPNDLGFGWNTDSSGNIVTVLVGSSINQKVITPNNTLDDGSGNASTAGVLSVNAPIASFAGTTSGTVYWVQDMQGTVKRTLIYLENYSNSSGTAQQITFPTAYKLCNAATYNGTQGGLASMNLQTITLISGNSTIYNGMIIVEGY